LIDQPLVHLAAVLTRVAIGSVDAEPTCDFIPKNEIIRRMWSPTFVLGLPANRGSSSCRSHRRKLQPLPACDWNASSAVTGKTPSSGAGERPDRTGQLGTALPTAMGNILKIVGGCSISEERRLNSRDHHSMSAIWAREQEGREA
jgi:hypothetical protein